MRFLYPENERQELTYNDVFLVPQYSEIHSRMDVDLTPSDRLGAIPLVVSNMNAVAGRRMAETTARRGGIVVFPQDMNWERIEQSVRYIKQCHTMYETAVVLNEDDTVQNGLNLISKRAHGAIIVVNKEHKPVGIFTEKEAHFQDRHTALKRVMRTDVITVPSSATPQEAYTLMEKNRVSLAPIIYPNGALAGVMTKKGAVRSTIYKPAQNARGELLTATAVSINRKLEETIGFLLTIGVDIIVLDTAHGHQKRMLDAIRAARRLLGNERPLVAGNVATEQAVKDFIQAGASIVKVGIGPGAMCTTRMMTGVGRPQFSAILHCARAARELGANVWADGGVRHPRDVVLAIAAGASHAMAGSWFAGTYESVGDMQYDEQGRPYKENFGMASRRAVIDRTNTSAVFEQARKKYFEEGISSSRMYLKKGEESAEDIIDKITAGLRSACTYTNASTLEEFYQKAIAGIQTNAGFYEGMAVLERW